jgi:hypothetical protein
MDVLMLDCHAVTRELWDYLEGEIEHERAESIRGHLALCELCMPYVQFHRAYLDVAAASPARSPEAVGQLRSRVLAALADIGGRMVDGDPSDGGEPSDG